MEIAAAGGELAFFAVKFSFFSCPLNMGIISKKLGEILS